MTQPMPLEKSLVHLDLSKGLNERDRPETANPMTTFSRVENLDQNQGGAWCKRAGGAALDNTSTFVPARVLRLRDGLGAVDDAANFYQYQESIGRYRARGTVPEFSVTSDTVVSSGPSTSPVIYSAGSSTLFHFMIHNAGLSVSSGQPSTYLSIYDRQSGAVVAQYDIGLIGGLNGAGAIGCFVDNRYIHVGMVTSVGHRGFVIDTQAPFPLTAASIVTFAALDAVAGGFVLDVEPGVGRSYFIIGGGIASRFMVSMSNALAVTLSAALTCGTSFNQPVVSFSGTKVWYMSDTAIGALDSATLAVSVAAAAHGGPGSNFAMAADRTDQVWCAYETATTFGGTTVTTVNFKKTNAGGTTLSGITCTLDGWRLGSGPFEALLGAGGYAMFIQLYKDSPLTIVPTVVVPMDGLVKSTPTVNANSYTSMKVSATVEPFLAVRNAGAAGSGTSTLFLKVNATDRSTANEFGLGVAVQVNARGFGYSMFVLKPSASAIACQTFAGVNYMSGGSHCFYGGGERPVEVGFLDIPKTNSVVGAAGLLNGSYKYVQQFRYTDETGAVTWSRTSPVEAISVTLKQVTMTCSTPNVTSKDKRSGATTTPPMCSVELYRTKAGGTQYYLCASSSVGSSQVLVLGAGRMYSVSDNMSDATLATQPTLFRQPGTPNSGLDRYPPPAGSILCQHRDRLFTTDTWGNRVCYSSFFVDGETAWFNPAFSFFAHGGSGRITAMVSMDGRLFIFKRDSIFVVDGDGPGEGGVAGNEFSPPQRLATEYGCVDPKSVVVMTDGIMYRSSRGIELLTRGLQVKWIGERVVNTALAYPVPLASFLDTNGRVHFVCASSLGATPAAQGTISGVELVYDTTTDSWSAYYGNNGSGYGLGMKDAVMANLYQKGEVACYAGVAATSYASSATGLDATATYVPWVVETVWIRNGQQTRQRINTACLLAKKVAGANHAIRISVAYDYVDGYTQVATFQPGVINATAIEMLLVNLVKPMCASARFLIEEIAPADIATFPVGTGLGAVILGISSEIVALPGTPKLATGQKA